MWARNTDKKLRPLLNINDHKLKKGSNHYFKELMALKRKNGFIHKEKKEIVAVSVEVANEFWDFVSTYEREKVA